MRLSVGIWQQFRNGRAFSLFETVPGGFGWRCLRFAQARKGLPLRNQNNF